jgi:hypothetical protein
MKTKRQFTRGTTCSLFEICFLKICRDEEEILDTI